MHARVVEPEAQAAELTRHELLDATVQSVLHEDQDTSRRLCCREESPTVPYMRSNTKFKSNSFARGCVSWREKEE